MSRSFDSIDALTGLVVGLPIVTAFWLAATHMPENVAVIVGMGALVAFGWGTSKLDNFLRAKA